MINLNNRLAATITADEIAEAKVRTSYAMNAGKRREGKPSHDDDCVRICAAWLSAQTLIRTPRNYVNKHVPEFWVGRYVSEVDFEIAVQLLGIPSRIVWGWWPIKFIPHRGTRSTTKPET